MRWSRAPFWNRGTATAALPVLIAADGVATALTFEPTREAAIGVGMLVSRGLDMVSAQGMIAGNLSADTAARSRFGFYDMTTNDPVKRWQGTRAESSVAFWR